MYFAIRRAPLARRGVAAGLVLAVHAVAVFGLLQVRAQRPPVPVEMAVEVSFVDGPKQESRAPERQKIRLADARPVFPDRPQLELPVTQTPAPAAITVPASTESAPPPAAPRADTPVVVASVDYLKPPAPRYPPKARRTRAEGTVLLQVLIDSQGHAREVQVHRSSGHEELDVAAREAVLAAAFRPHLENGVARNALVIVPIEFSLTIRTASR